VRNLFSIFRIFVDEIQNFIDADGHVFGLEEWLEFYDRPMELALERGKPAIIFFPTFADVLQI
jgi:hypothetical protein